MNFASIDPVWRFFKILGGFTFLGAGAVMLFTPCPGWPVIILGLTVLGAEFVWARRLIDRMKNESTRLKDTVLKLGKNSSAYLHRNSSMTENMLRRLSRTISGSQVEKKYALEDVFWVPITNCKCIHSASPVLPKLHPESLATGEHSSLG
jgi:hypothetical protein